MCGRELLEGGGGGKEGGEEGVDFIVAWWWGGGRGEGGGGGVNFWKDLEKFCIGINTDIDIYITTQTRPQYPSMQ